MVQSLNKAKKSGSKNYYRVSYVKCLCSEVDCSMEPEYASFYWNRKDSQHYFQLY